MKLADGSTLEGCLGVLEFNWGQLKVRKAGLPPLLISAFHLLLTGYAGRVGWLVGFFFNSSITT